MAPRQVESSAFCTLNVCGANVSELEALAGEAMHECGMATGSPGSQRIGTQWNSPFGTWPACGRGSNSLPKSRMAN
eukprot:1439298-Amphidinium_carterae.1